MIKYLGNVYGEKINYNDSISPMCFCLVDACGAKGCGVN